MTYEVHTLILGEDIVGEDAGLNDSYASAMK